MERNLLLILFLLLSIQGYSQQLMITGKVIIDNTDEILDLQSILILNQQSGSKSKVNQNGIFSIKVSVNDVLEISGSYVESREIKISENVIKKGFIEIHLDVETIELAEANINPLSKNLNKNISNEDSQTTKNYESWGLDPNLQYIEVNPNMTSSLNNNGLLDPALWISKATGKYKKDKKQNEYFNKMTVLDLIKGHFTEHYFLTYLKIPEFKVNEFLNFTAAQSNIVLLFKNNKFEEVEMHLQQFATKYVQLISQNK